MPLPFISSRFREELRSKMNAQIDFLKRCKELGLQGGKLSNWLDEYAKSVNRPTHEVIANMYNYRRTNPR